MAIVIYKCDTCKRTVELQRNIRGMEHVGRCNITHGCRGKLYQTRLLPDYIRGSIPTPVIGLDDWKSRKVLYNHDQPIERLEWIIEHDMGVIPVVSVYVDRPLQNDHNHREEITPDDIVVVDDNTIKLVFSRPWSGIAQLVSSQSDPDLFKDTTRNVVSEESPIQLTTKGEFTVATRVGAIDPNTDINLQIEYRTTTNTVVDVNYTVDTEPSIISPWVDYNGGVVIKGQIYKVRSFNALVPEMADGTIGSGSTFVFTGIDMPGSPISYNPIQPGDILLLLSNSPHQTVDKVLDQFIDVADVTNTNNPNGFYYNKSEFFAIPSLSQTVYPPIRSI